VLTANSRFDIMQKLTPFYFWKKLVSSKTPFEATRVVSGYMAYNVNNFMYNIQQFFKKD